MERSVDGAFEAFWARPDVRSWARRFEARRFATLAVALVMLGAGTAAIVAVVSGGVPLPWLTPEDRMSVAFFALVLVVPLLVLFVWELVRQRRAFLKLPVLAAAAEARGMAYAGAGFQKPLDDYYLHMLAGEWGFSGQSFTDFFHGYYPDGAGYTFFEARLIRGQGKGASTALAGTVHAYGRAGPEMETVVWSHGNLFGHHRPNGPWPRVMTGDAAFDAALVVRALDAEEAQRLLGRTALARFLLELRREGRVYAYVGPHLAVLSVGGDRFEVGPLIAPRGAKARARRMWDEVRESEEVLRRWRELVG